MPLPLWTHTHATRALANRIAAPSPPPVLVLSLPRSGSSWVGEVLGSTSRALYLREPMNQLHLARGGPSTLFDVESEGLSSGYQDALRRVLAADPRFPDHLDIVPDPGQWNLRRRRGARLVVKEVNPFAAGWLVDALSPQLVLLVRHPAAVTRSFLRLGWWGDDTGELAGLDDWRWCGARLGHVLHAGLTRTQHWEQRRIVRYEDLCADPVRTFQALVEFTGLHWSAELAAGIRARSEGGDRDDTYATARDSRAMADAWRAEVTPEQAAALREGWEQVDLPWYRDKTDW